MLEIYKDLAGYGNRYEVSNLGNVRIKENKKILKQFTHRKYKYVGLYYDNKTHSSRVHRLVAKTFFNDYCDNLEVNHINGIKTDNRIENLEMTTHCENIKKRYEIGNDGNNYKEVEQYDLDGNYIKTYKSSYEAEKMTGVCRTCIGGCCRNEHHTAGGYIWKFKSKIEEDKKIEKLDLQYKDITKGINFEKQILSYCDNLQYKINEIIDYINKEDK